MQGNNEKNRYTHFSIGKELKSDKIYSVSIGGRGSGKSILQVKSIIELCKDKEFKLCQFSARMIRFILDDEFPNYDIRCNKKYVNNHLIFNIYFMSDNFFNYYTVAGNMIFNDVIATLKEIIPNGKEEK